MPDQPLDSQEADAAPSAGADAPPDPVAQLQKERDALQDRLLRTAAEFDNYRKRVERERREQADNAAADILADLLPVIDDLERALHAPHGADAEAYWKGVDLIHKQMIEMLRRRGVSQIEAVGAEFDPRYHQAVDYAVTSSHRDGEVVEDLRRGYMLGSRLLRPTMVKVAKRE